MGAVRKTVGATLAATVVSAAAVVPANAAVVERGPAAVKAYWTKQRMRSAIPMPLAQAPLAGLPTAPPKRGLPVTVAPAAPKRRGSSLHTQVRHPRRFPARTQGKVFLTENAVDYVCSGTAVRSPSRSLVLTAGHCVYQTGLNGGYATNFAFVPGYKNHRRPFGTWPATKLRTTPQYKGSLPILDFGGDESFDIGAATVAKHNGRSLQSAIGARGVVFNRNRSQHYQAYGYPAESPPPEFDGQHLFRCDSGFGGSDNNSNFSDPQPMWIHCDMTGGSSGGGWVIKKRYVASVNAYGYTGEPNKLYGPYFGAAAQDLYDSMRNG